MPPSPDRPAESSDAKPGVAMQGRLLLEILSHMAEAVLLADRHGVFQFANPAAEALLGERLMAMRAAEWTSELGVIDPATGRPLEQDALPVTAALRGEAVDLRRLVIRRPGMEDRTVGAVARVVRGEAGEVTGAVLVLRDVTGRQEAVDALARSAIARCS